MLNTLKITDEEFRLIKDLIYKRFGINLSDQKKALVTGRLQTTLKELDLSNFSEYYDFLIKDSTGIHLQNFIDKISTNHTFFFRENEHYEYMFNIALPHISKENKDKEIRVWSAGCSSGEEPYTIAVVLAEYFKEKLQDWKIKILASDISLSILKNAHRGIYSEDKLKYVEKNLKSRYFSKISDKDWQVKDSIRDIVMFKKLNFMDEKFPFKNKFDIIFCRNVMIYFDEITRKKLVNKFIKFIKTNGWLFIGHSETLGNKYPDLKYIKPAIYRRV